jgi:tartronate-semialdehyde synthase
MLIAAERPILIAGGGVINSDASELLVDFAEITNTPVVPTLMGWGSIPEDHRLNAGMVGIQTQHRYGNANFLRSDFVLGIGNRWANRHTGTTLGIYTKDRKFVHVDVDPMQIGRVFCPDLGIVADARLALKQFVETARTYQAKGLLPDRSEWVREIRSRKATMHRKTHFDDQPIKPQRVFQEINQVFDDETRFVTAIGLYQIASGQFQRVNQPRHYLVCGQAGPLGWEIPACIGAKLAEPEREVVAVVGDLSFQFLIEELAVAAQHRVGFVMVLLNNAYLGLIRQAEVGYSMDFQVQTSFSNRNAPEIGDYGVDHVGAVEALGGIALRVTDPKELAQAFQKARALVREHSVPVVVEVITERVTNIAMGAEIDQVKEFEPIDDRPLPAELKEAAEATNLVGAH